VAKRPDEELILFFYGEHESPDEIKRELASDAELSSRYAALTRDLSALDALEAPEPRAGIEMRMWARVAPELAPQSARTRVRSRWLLWGAATAAAVSIALVGFIAGRTVREEPTEIEVAAHLKAMPPEARDRVLQAALADHLDASQRLLLEVANGAPTVDEERVWAETLLSANRLYRRAAERAGQHRVAGVLAELEPFLTQLANAPETFDLHRTQQQLRHEDLLFKVRITRNNLKELS
jgi:hypothetical protein